MIKSEKAARRKKIAKLMASKRMSAVQRNRWAERKRAQQRSEPENLEEQHLETAGSPDHDLDGLPDF